MDTLTDSERAALRVYLRTYMEALGQGDAPSPDVTYVTDDERRNFDLEGMTVAQIRDELADSPKRSGRLHRDRLDVIYRKLFPLSSMLG